MRESHAMYKTPPCTRVGLAKNVSPYLVYGPLRFIGACPQRHIARDKTACINKLSSGWINMT